MQLARADSKFWKTNCPLCKLVSISVHWQLSIGRLHNEWILPLFPSLSLWILQVPITFSQQCRLCLYQSYSLAIQYAYSYFVAHSIITLRSSLYDAVTSAIKLLFSPIAYTAQAPTNQYLTSRSMGGVRYHLRWYRDLRLTTCIQYQAKSVDT